MGGWGWVGWGGVRERESYNKQLSKGEKSEEGWKYMERWEGKMDEVHALNCCCNLSVS